MKIVFGGASQFDFKCLTQPVIKKKNEPLNSFFIEKAANL